MRHTLLVTLLLLSTSQACFAEDPPGVAAAREAALQHNDAIAEADSNLETAIAAAHRSHTRQVIAAKERMINSLRRAYRSALRSSQPENAGTIERQIAVLHEQIEELKDQINASAAIEDPELEEIYPAKDVNEWLGHSEPIARAHYRMALDKHFNAATGLTLLDSKATMHMHATDCDDEQEA